MNIAIIGTGNVGSVLGRRLGALGHAVTFVSRNPNNEKASVLRGLPGVVGVASSVAELIGQGEVFIYAGPYDHAKSILEQAGDFGGAILVDCTNPLNKTFDGLQLGHTESAAERIAEWAAGSRVVKSFNTSSVATMADPTYGGHAATQFYCGDDPGAKEIVRGLIRELEMEPVDAGPLSNARYLEATAMLYIHLAVRGGWGGNCALKMLRR
jgi:predicted dinucleotide-binding enzyme